MNLDEFLEITCGFESSLLVSGFWVAEIGLQGLLGGSDSGMGCILDSLVSTNGWSLVGSWVAAISCIFSLKMFRL